MSEAWTTSASWFLRTAMGGGLLLLLVWVLMRWTRQPARRQRLGECGVVAALAVAVLSVASFQWLSLPDPRPTTRLRTAAAPIPQLSSPRAEKPSSAGIPPAPTVPSAPAPAAPAVADAAAPLVDPPEALAEFPLPQPQPAAEAAPAPPVDPPPAPVERAVAAETPPVSPASVASEWSCLAPAVVYGLILAYALGAAFLAGRWLYGYFLLRRLLRTAAPAPVAVAQLFAEMAAARGAAPRLLVAHRLRVPLSCGLFRPTVVLPSALCASAPSPALRWVFAHELTHLERRDIWACLLFGLGQLVYYYLPWFWWLRRQVGLCQEYVADAAAVGESTGAEEYAQFLLTLTGVPAVPAGAHGVAGNSSDLFRRVSMLLQSPVQVEKRCPRLWSLAVAGGLLALATLVAAVGLHADAAPLDDQRDPAAADPAKLDKDPAKKEEPKLEQTKDPAKKEEPKPAADKDPTKTEEPAQKPAARPKRLDPQALRKRLEQMMRDGASPEEMQKEMMKAMEEFRGQALGGPLGGGFPQHMIEFGKAMQRRHEFTMPVDGRVGMRLGAMLMKPSAALRDQLDLPQDQGLVLEYLIPDLPAAAAGLKVNDILLELDGKPVPSESQEFARLVEGIKADTSVDAIILRKGKKETIKGLTLPGAPGAAGFGGQPFPFPVFPAAVPPLPLVAQVPAVPGVLPALGAGGGHAVMTTVVRTGDRITTRYQEGNLIITLTGSVADGKAKIGEIHVQDGAVTHKYDSADKVPELYRAKVKGLIEMSEMGNIRVEIKTP
jgi:beta-lactamase regulating signal transducer with metallopeptidase domain